MYLFCGIKFKKNLFVIGTYLENAANIFYIKRLTGKFRFLFHSRGRDKSKKKFLTRNTG